MTTGANGTTALLADEIETLAKQMLSKGEITQQEYASMAQLSNQGHKIAEIEQLLQDVVQQNDPEKLQNTYITYDGKIYPIRELALQVI